MKIRPPPNILFINKIILAVWCNGSTPDFDSVGVGSSPTTVVYNIEML